MHLSNTRNLQQGETALHVACRYGQTSTAQFLTTLHISVDAQDKNLETALHISAWNGHARIAQVLLKAGANKLIKNEVTSIPFSVRYCRVFPWCTGLDWGLGSQHGCAWRLLNWFLSIYDV